MSNARMVEIEREMADAAARKFAPLSERELVSQIAKLTADLAAYDYRIVPNHPVLIAAARAELASRR